MIDLSGKRILFLSAYFFDYNQEICKALRRRGAIVDYFDERPANSFFVKAVIRLRPELLRKYIEKYHSGIIESTKKNQYDYILFIKAESITCDKIKEIKSLHPQATMILYLWDSISNFKNGIQKIRLFDHVLSFDRYDCKMYGLEFRPLFYCDCYKHVARGDADKQFDILFIGTMHSDRYRFVKKVEQLALEKGRTVYYYLFFMSKILYYKMKFSDRALKNTCLSDFQFKSISQAQIVELLSRTQCVIDIQHPKQTGLTMRTIEILGARRKLITTNGDIVNYDFYNPANILVVDRVNPVLDDDFFRVDYQPVSPGIYDYYALDHWIDSLVQR